MVEKMCHEESKSFSSGRPCYLYESLLRFHRGCSSATQRSVHCTCFGLGSACGFDRLQGRFHSDAAFRSGIKIRQHHRRKLKCAETVPLIRIESRIPRAVDARTRKELMNERTIYHSVCFRDSSRFKRRITSESRFSGSE